VVHRGVHGVEWFEFSFEECSQSLSDVPDSDWHYVAWMNLSQHYRTGLSPYRVEIFSDRESR